MGMKINSGSDLEFIEPIVGSDGKEVAVINRSEILETVNKWSYTLVGYVMGNKPFFMHLKTCVTRLWKQDCSLDIYSTENGFFFLNLLLKLNVIGFCIGDHGSLREAYNCKKV